MHPAQITQAIGSIIKDSLQVFVELLKVMLPALVAVKIAQTFGLVDSLGIFLSPVMALLGLPAVLGIVWATALATNLFTALVVFFQMAGELSLTVEQVSVLGIVLLLAHSLPVEGAVAKRAGISWWTTVTLRVGGAIVLGTAMHSAYSALDIYQMPAQFHWQPTQVDDTLLSWLVSQLYTLAIAFIIITALITLMRTLKALGIEKLLHIMLAPFLRTLGIGKAATNVTVIGATLGLSYGAGLLIRDIDSGAMSRRDAYLSICFIGLAHSLIEDTLLILTLGADLSSILWIRLAFAFVVIALIARLTANPRPIKSAS